MRTIYQIDGDNIATGASREIGPKEGRPRGWVASDTPPPAGLAKWQGTWVVLDERPTPPGPYQTDDAARAAMLGFINDLTKTITDQYPAAEVSAWPSKAEAARAVIAGTAREDQTSMISAEAALVGSTTEEQAAAIVAKAENYESIVSKVSGLRQKTEALIVASTTSQEREAVLGEAKSQAILMATEAGLV